MDRLLVTDKETELTMSIATEQDGNNESAVTTQFECVVCQRSFDTLIGLKIHQGRVCMKQKRQRLSSDYQTRSKSSQEANHSGMIITTVDPVNVPAVNLAEKKPKVVWPASNNKKAWKEFEVDVLKKTKKMKGTTAEKLKFFEDCIYSTGKEQFGTKEIVEKKVDQVGGKSRKQRLVEKLRKEKKELRKRWKLSPSHEKDGLQQLYEDLKKRSRLIQRNMRRLKRRKESQRARAKFLKNPYAEAKKLFVEQKSGVLKCTKEELDEHVKKTYSDAKRHDVLPPMEKLAVLPEPKFKFVMGDLKKEVDDMVTKARAKSAPGGNGVSYKVYKYCNQLRYKLYLLLKKLWKEKALVDDWTYAEGVYLPKEENATTIEQFRPISTLSVGCKIYMGILARRTMTFLRQNKFINEEVQKAGIPSLPDCI